MNNLCETDKFFHFTWLENMGVWVDGVTGFFESRDNIAVKMFWFKLVYRISYFTQLLCDRIVYKNSK